MGGIIIANPSHEELADLMEFDHIVRVLADGTLIDSPLFIPIGLHAPDMLDDELQAGTDGWQLMTGHTGQHGYNGPTMHPSEYIGGGLASAILDHAGLYVAIVSYISNEGDDVAGWAIAYIKDES